jgi:hypothetical protein
MRRFMTILGVALLGYALLPSAAQAQVIVVQSPRTYSAPIIVGQPVQVYYAAPSVTTFQPNVTYSYYPSTTTTFSVGAAPSVVTFSAPATVMVPASGVITTRTSYGYGIFRPRGYYTESYYTPLR